MFITVDKGEKTDSPIVHYRKCMKPIEENLDGDANSLFIVPFQATAEANNLAALASSKDSYTKRMEHVSYLYQCCFHNVENMNNSSLFSCLFPLRVVKQKVKDARKRRQILVNSLKTGRRRPFHSKQTSAQETPEIRPENAILMT